MQKRIKFFIENYMDTQNKIEMKEDILELDSLVNRLLNSHLIEDEILSDFFLILKENRASWENLTLKNPKRIINQLSSISGIASGGILNVFYEDLESSQFVLINQLTLLLKNLTQKEIDFLISTKNLFNKTALFMAFEFADDNQILTLLNAASSEGIRKTVFIETKDNENIFHIAIRTGRSAAVIQTLMKKLSPDCFNLLMKYNFLGYTPLAYCTFKMGLFRLKYNYQFQTSAQTTLSILEELKPSMLKQLAIFPPRNKYSYSLTKLLEIKEDEISKKIKEKLIPTEYTEIFEEKIFITDYFNPRC